MLSRNEYLYIKGRIKRLEDMLFEFEMRSDLYTVWQKFIALSPLQQEILTKQWNEYYAKCHDSYYGQMFRKAGVLFKAGRHAEAKRMAQEVKQSIVPMVKKPSSIDPTELRQKIQTYFDTRHLVEQLKKELGEYKDVYEKNPEGL